MKKRKILLLVVCLLALWLLLSGNMREAAVKWRIESLVRTNHEVYTQAAEPILTGEPVPEMDLPGVRALNRWRSEKDGSVWIADFAVTGWGIAPSSIYWGFYTTTDGEPAGFQGTNDTLTPDGVGWSWQQPGGDNAYYTEEINDGWYYYRATF